MRARTGHRGRALAAAFVGLAGAFVAAVAAVPPAAAAGSVSLFDDSGGTPLFNGAVLAPGHPQTGCVSVSAAGATPTDAVVLSASGVAGSLAQYLSVDVQVGTGGHLGNCTGWVADPAVPAWSGHLGDLVPGVVTGWYPAASASRTFRFTVQVDDVAAASGTSAGGQFVWQLTTTPPPPPPPSPSPSASPSPSVSPSPSPSVTPTPTPTPTLTPKPTPTVTTPAPTNEPGPTTQPEPTTAPTAQPTATNEPGPTVPTDAPAPTGLGPDPLVGTDSPTPSATPAGELPGDGSGQPGATPSASGAPGAAGSGGGPGNGGSTGGSRAHHPAADVVLGVSLPALRETARRVSEVAMHLAEAPQYPVGVLALVAVFLLVQDLIDRRDPKLAVARVTGRDSRLRFPDLFPPERGP